MTAEGSPQTFACVRTTAHLGLNTYTYTIIKFRKNQTGSNEHNTEYLTQSIKDHAGKVWDVFVNTIIFDLFNFSVSFYATKMACLVLNYFFKLFSVVLFIHYPSRQLQSCPRGHRAFLSLFYWLCRCCGLNASWFLCNLSGTYLKPLSEKLRTATEPLYVKWVLQYSKRAIFHKNK